MIDVSNPQVVDLLASLLTRYSYGAGQPSDWERGWPGGVKGIHGGVGWDCSGFAQVALVRLGLLRSTASDRSAAALFDASEVIARPAMLGDMAFYGSRGKISHVMLCIGQNAVLGASGGTSATNGDDARAYVQVRSLGYRIDLVGVRRLKASEA